jgi:chromatin segregation and condensation protein Rec8/ScpA/Scc1 (kleisin family)
VVRFLALLELCKLGLVELHQAQRFGDITVAWSASPDQSADGDARVPVGSGARW